MRFRAIIELIRLPNVFTVIADVLMGYLVVHPNLLPLPRLVCLLGSSIGLYWAGMVLNDGFDVAQDRQQRPDRPIPSGRVSLGAARATGLGLWVFGLLLGVLAGYLAPQPELPWRPAVMALLVGVCVLLYDAVAKRTVAGPWLMGACRAGNILLGMSTGAVDPDSATALLRFDAVQLALAGGLGVYVTGITLFARDEATEDGGPSRSLWMGVLVMLAGLCLLASVTLFPAAQTGGHVYRIHPSIWPLAVLLLGSPLIRRAFSVALHPTSKGVQAVVRNSLLSLIVFDAAICLLIRSPWSWSVLILGLLVPTLLLRRWFYST